MSRIDTHHHVVPPEYAAWLRSKGALAGGLPIPDWDAASALALMDAHDVRAAVLSVSTPGTFLGDGADARAIARDVNDFAAQQVRDQPDRFGFFATLTLPDVDGSLAELDRAYDVLGADGVVLYASNGNTYLGDPAATSRTPPTSPSPAWLPCTRAATSTTMPAARSITARQRGCCPGWGHG